MSGDRMFETGIKMSNISPRGTARLIEALCAVQEIGRKIGTSLKERGRHVRGTGDMQREVDSAA